MKITVVGGSQGTGAALAALATKAGHDVTALSRSGGAPGGVRALAGDATNADVVRAAIVGADAVVVTVGGAKGAPRQRSAVTRAVISAMEQEGIRRLVVQSSLGAGDSGALMPAPLRLPMKGVLAAPLADHNEQEAAVQGSALRWTIVRPTGLTHKPALGTWRALQVGQTGRLGGTIPRGDLAAYMLEALGDDSLIGAAVGISS
ncbi:NAD(P)-dependent oxidoreductase [Sanguibacter sp. A247]|uniref:NAD(P)-dependent oxidoreductase n=1 Tax=unclassified Sanguibacter TaxID=2645534 RepID=UPI003FD7404B